MTDIEALAQLITPQIPISVDLWSATEAAAFFKVTPRHFSERIACQSGFPRPLRIPTGKAGKSDKVRTGHPRWKAIEVVKWANENG